MAVAGQAEVAEGEQTVTQALTDVTEAEVKAPGNAAEGTEPEKEVEGPISALESHEETLDGRSCVCCPGTHHVEGGEVEGKEGSALLPSAASQQQQEEHRDAAAQQHEEEEYNPALPREREETKNEASKAEENEQTAALPTSSSSNHHDDNGSLLEEEIPKEVFRQYGAPREEYVIHDTPRGEEPTAVATDQSAHHHSSPEGPPPVGDDTTQQSKQEMKDEAASRTQDPHEDEKDEVQKNASSHQNKATPKPSSSHEASSVPRYMSPKSQRVNEPPAANLSSFLQNDPLLQHRKPYRLTIVEVEGRENASRTSIERQQAQERSQLETAIVKGLSEGAWTEAQRAKYLESEVFLKAVEVGRQRRARVDQWEDQKAKAVLETMTFKPEISRTASQRPSRTPEEFAKDNEEWLQELAKKRRAASAVVVREEDATFTPKILPASQKIIERLQQQDKHVSIAFGWEKRMEEHKAKLLEIQLRHTPSFHPNLASIHHRPSTTSSSSQVSGESPNLSSPSRSQQAVIQRLYLEALAHKRETETKYQAQREASASPARKKKAEDILQHIAAMRQRTEQAQRKLETKRAKAERDEREQEGNKQHIPTVNKHSIAIVGERPNGASPSYQQTTKAFDQRRQSSLEQYQGGSSNSRPSVIRTAEERSKEFLLRSERTVQAKAQRVQALRAQKEEEETKECTFAPSISHKTQRYAELRRSEGRRGYDDFDNTMWEASYSPAARVPHLRESMMNAVVFANGGSSSSPPKKTMSSSSLRSAELLPTRGAHMPRAGSTAAEVKLSNTPHRSSQPLSSPQQAAATTLTMSHLDANMEDLENLLQQWRQLEAMS